MKSTKILMIINVVAMTKTAPVTTGKSNVFNAFTISFPNPFQPNINSTKTAPANMDANQPEVAVITGFNAFLSACLQMISFDFNPLSLSVMIYFLLYTFNYEILVIY